MLVIALRAQFVKRFLMINALIRQYSDPAMHSSSDVVRVKRDRLRRSSYGLVYDRQ